VSRRIRCVDLPGPEGAYVAFPSGLHPFDDDAAEALAQDGMMLSLSPEHAAALIEEGRRAAELDAFAAHS
jgi:hypothetical protein